MKIENYEKAKNLVDDISVLKEVIEGDRFDLRKALWITEGFKDQEFKILADKIQKWCREELQPSWNAIIDARLKQLEEL